MSLDDDMREALDMFVTEARDLVQGLEEGLLELEDQPAGGETVNAVFRAAHTLKGSSGLFGLRHLVEFTHVVETVLGSVREGQLDVTPGLVSALLPCTDHISAMIEGIAEGRLEPDASQLADGTRLLAGLSPYLDGGAAPAASVATPGAEAAPAEAAWRLGLRFGPDCLRNGMDPLSFLRYLSTIGTVTGVVTDASGLPDAEEMDPESCYLSFDVDLVTAAPKAEIEAVFDFVREDSDIRITPSESQLDAYVRAIRAMPENDRIGDVLVTSGAVTEMEMAEALRVQQERAVREGTQPVPIGEILIEQGIVQRDIVDAALTRQRRTTETRSQDTRTIRIDAARLDKLIDLVGELVIAQSSTGVTPGVSAETSNEAQGEVMRLVDEVRHSALSLRMVPIGTTLRRFERVVRDVSMELGKEVSLTITGGDAEMDKALVERISDPLLHLVRNSLDHGIEPAAERRKHGKTQQGTLRLNAYHDAGNIVIEVADDGCGLDRDRILGKAIERELVAPGTALTDAEVYNLIFEPGFSTAEKVSNLSGRGVGMDVVKRNVTALRGSIEVETTRGIGTTIRIRLPLTLAIIDGFLVGVGPSSFIVPLDRVTECVELPPGPLGRDCMNLRGEVLPFIRLRQLFGIPGEPARRQNVVIVEQSGQRTGLVVDSLLGELQTVIKPLGVLFSRVRCISGSTILGNGEIALILDVGTLIAGHSDREHTRQAVAVG
ncbi:two-component system chemotaxis sensor kinase CheA [Actinoplanes lutulentus]|uniref:Chemotaxis protein CheA n=1 Tax=Actinoplanes lutulentus TaxID=1287878 RepID=A0A327Z901_9ACTN|nr:chemotaxis protein CheA [Actinoplanes lutulentus]MBB2946950.1 two-component system chemotaxis sensor kinase CheA [Actinoplanes lutulentus]RAK30452.1 two-component system chemotaxis sensor kinase CheA [Actinoplanes lutulentus]